MKNAMWFCKLQIKKNHCKVQGEVHRTEHRRINTRRQLYSVEEKKKRNTQSRIAQPHSSLSLPLCDPPCVHFARLCCGLSKSPPGVPSHHHPRPPQQISPALPKPPLTVSRFLLASLTNTLLSGPFHFWALWALALLLLLWFSHHGGASQMVARSVSTLGTLNPPHPIFDALLSRSSWKVFFGIALDRRLIAPSGGLSIVSAIDVVSLFCGMQIQNFFGNANCGIRLA